MHTKALVLLLTASAALSACAASGTVQSGNMQKEAHTMMTAKTHSVTSHYAFQETLNRLQEAIRAKGMMVFTAIDHQAAARKHGLQMQPATVLIFGAPKAGTPLMVKDPAFALQLPLRVLVTEVNGQVQVVFNDTRALISGSHINYADVENTLANAEKLIRATVSQ